VGRSLRTYLLDFPAHQSVNSRDSNPQEENMTTQKLVQGGDAGRWEQAIYAFLAEKSAGEAPCISIYCLSYSP